FDAFGAHQPGDLVPADVVSGPTSGLPQLPRPVDAVVVFPQLAQRRGQFSVAPGTCRRPARLGGVVGARRHLQPCVGQDRADGLDSELLALHDVVAVGVDERHYLLCWRSSSAPKKLAARLRISFARLSSRFSCSSSLIRWASAVLTPGA